MIAGWGYRATTGQQEMARDYLTPEPWLSEVHRFLAARPRDAGNPEHATVLRADLERAGLCDGEDDWLVLSNRLVVDHAVHLVDGETLLHVARARQVRVAVQEQRHPGKIVSVRRIVEATGRAEGYVRAVLKNMLEGPTQQIFNGGWISEDEVRVPQMSVGGFGLGGRPSYPRAPLVGLYERDSGEPLGTGGTATVALHRLSRDVLFARRGQPVAVKLVRHDGLVHLNGDATRGRKRLLREFDVGRRHR